ncbi:hypothetical protein [Mesorhizobium sp. IMUNJ 23232]|uniref:hypothetical protein n=1 Tax=Mesorhizobium sp. IMUNJ 23232 TaxID=3376064 RepID=UPI0037A18480
MAAELPSLRGIYRSGLLRFWFSAHLPMSANAKIRMGQAFSSETLLLNVLPVSGRKSDNVTAGLGRGIGCNCGGPALGSASMTGSS